MKSFSCKNRGFANASTIFFFLVIGLLLFVAYNVFPFYYYSYELQGHFDAQAKVGFDRSEKEIREFLMMQIDKLEIPIDSERDLIINKFQDSLTIELEYLEVFWLTLGSEDYKIWEFPFHIKSTSNTHSY